MAATSGCQTIRVPAVMSAKQRLGTEAVTPLTLKRQMRLGSAVGRHRNNWRWIMMAIKSKGTSLAAASPLLSANQNCGQSRHLSLFSAVSAHSVESLVEQACCRYHASGARNLGKANIRQEASYSVVVCR